MLFVFIWILSSCQSTNTKVRTVSLSYNFAETNEDSNLVFKNFALLNIKKVENQTNKFIIPGDMFIFTIELEDPDFEFISLLSIKFNNQTIRANVNNSIVKTRDCGSNICLDFPFEIRAEESNYVVQEVKFAKLNESQGVNAIIDDQSINTISLDIYTGMFSPYIASSVNKINRVLDQLTYYSEHYLNNEITIEELNAIMYSSIQNTLTILDIKDSPSVTDEILEAGWWGKEIGPLFYRVFSGELESTFAYISAFGVSIEPTIQQSYLEGSIKTIKTDDAYLYVRLFYDGLNDAQAFSVGNDIFIKISGIDYHIITLEHHARIVDFQYTLYDEQ